jgi:hypothetical protein
MINVSGVEMFKPLKILVAAGLLAATAGMASAAPASNAGQIAAGVGDGLTQVHGFHRSCQRGRRGWHRHNRFGERRECREWRGRGRRPDACVRFGPVYYCDY